MRFRASGTLAMLGIVASLWAQAAPPASPFDAQQLPHVSGVVRTYTLIPPGAVDGFFLDDGTQVLTAPPLSTEVLQIARPGERVMVYGLKARSGSLVLALAITNEASHKHVLLGDIPWLLALGGPLPGHPGHDAHPATSQHSMTVSMDGVVKQTLYGPRATVNGAVLEDGTILRIASTEAQRAAPHLTPGARIALKGERIDSPQGRLVLVSSIGATGQPLVELAPWDGPR